MRNNFSKIFIAGLVIVYVLSTVGVSVFCHYCGGELEKVSLFTKTKSCCGGEEDEAAGDDGCCKNELTHVSFQKDFTFGTIINHIKASVCELFTINSKFNFNSFKHYSISILSIDRKFHPPNLVQDAIISSSVIRV